VHKRGSIVCKLHPCLPKGPTNSAGMHTIVIAALQQQYLQTELILWIRLVFGNGSNRSELHWQILWVEEDTRLPVPQDLSKCIEWRVVCEHPSVFSSLALFFGFTWNFEWHIYTKNFYVNFLFGSYQSTIILLQTKPPKKVYEMSQNDSLCSKFEHGIKSKSHNWLHAV
jgi:hypothetical protein